MTEFDASEFVDRDFQTARQGNATAATTGVETPGQRAPTREEMESRVGEMQHKLSELRRAQAELERERASLEETRRRQAEFGQGREEMVRHITRGIGLLEEAEFAARRDAEQMGRTLVDLRETLLKVEGIQEETWTKESLNAELARASTVIENARMEWNSARMKFPLLNGEGLPTPGVATVSGVAGASFFEQLIREQNYAELCKLGLALTWPVALTGAAIVLVLLLR